MALAGAHPFLDSLRRLAGSISRSISSGCVLIRTEVVAAAGMRTLYQNMRKQKLDAAQHLPLHGRVGTNDEFLRIAGQTGAKRNQLDYFRFLRWTLFSVSKQIGSRYCF